MLPTHQTRRVQDGESGLLIHRLKPWREHETSGLQKDGEEDRRPTGNLVRPSQCDPGEFFAECFRQGQECKFPSQACPREEDGQVNFGVDGAARPHYVSSSYIEGITGDADSD